MIKYVKGDILDSMDEAIVIPVNCVGVMGKGLALQFKEKHPDIFKVYVGHCAQGTIKVGECATIVGEDERYLYRTPFKERYYIMFPTKNHWREWSSRDGIQRGLENLASQIFMFDIESISLPRLGCGEGQMHWRVVKPMIEVFNRRYRTKDCRITVYEYDENA